MPRLVGKSSNKGLVFGGVIVVLAIATAGTLEYIGVIDVIPGFGQNTSSAPILPERQNAR
jgi:hypothetical protein